MQMICPYRIKDVNLQNDKQRIVQAQCFATPIVGHWLAYCQKLKTTKKQIISFNHILHNLYSTSVSLAKNNSIYKFYYYFEDTNLLFSFPVSYEYSYG